MKMLSDADFSFNSHLFKEKLCSESSSVVLKLFGKTFDSPACNLELGWTTDSHLYLTSPCYKAELGTVINYSHSAVEVSSDLLSESGLPHLSCELLGCL